MKSRTKHTIRVISLILILALVLCGCGKGKQEEVPLAVKDLAVKHETEFGGVYIVITIDDFNALGFEYGDSVDVVFSSGYTLEDIPYYNGYYVDAGDPLLIAYPGYEYIKAAINYGEDLWDTAMLMSSPRPDLFVTAKLEEHSTAEIILREKGKYLDTQKARDLSYTDIREEYPSDEVFANFREVTVGDIREGILFRGASPCDNQHKRASYSDKLIEAAGVRCILDLADNDVKIEKYISSDSFASPYFLSLYNDGKVIPVALAMNFSSEDFAASLAMGLIRMASLEGPYYVHCTEGKDRTGFVMMLLEALTGATWQEIVDDYMLTYDNYYKINPQKDPEKYALILEKNLVVMMRTVIGDPEADPAKADLAAAAREYL
ncbi:MAG: tyrosine-protein phosphatase, partial [Eubacteriales bacterium]|nr:tyrosine-protein phosphatase [Eubacteriales bacterium]